MPSEIRKFFAASARRWPRPRLYSVDPRSSQWPSMRHAHLRIRTQELRVLGQRFARIRPQVGLVEIEERILHVLLEKFLHVRRPGRRGVAAGAFGAFTSTRALAVAVPPDPVAVMV